MPRGFESQVIRHRKLLRSFVARDLRARYAGSSLGIFWSVIHPLIILLLYIVVFSTLARGKFNIHGRVVGYALYLCPAILAWNWFNESLSGAASSVTNNGSLIKKVVFPSTILPLNPILAGLIPFGVAMLAFFVFAAVVGAFHPVTLLYFPIVVALQFFLTLGPAYLLASLNVFLRDTAQLLVAVLQFLFWGTPIVYPEEAITQAFPWIKPWFAINPVAHLMTAYRDVIIGQRPPSTGAVLYLGAIAIVAYHAGRILFVRGRRHFPDEV